MKTIQEDTMEDETPHILATSLLLRDTANDRSAAPIDDLTIALTLRKHELSVEPEDGGNIFQNVLYYSSDSEPSTPNLINCRLENVDFVQCKFQNTEFCNLTLKNVAFFYVECYNVSITDLSLEDCLWKTTIVQNAVLVHKHTTNTRDARVTVLEPYSPRSGYRPEDNTVIETRPLDGVPPKLAEDIERYENRFQASVSIVQLPQRDLLLQLADHKHIVSQIVQKCVAEDDPVFLSKMHRRQDRLTQVITLRNAASGTIHLHCPESTREVCVAALALPYFSTTIPTTTGGFLHGSLARIQCIISSLRKLRWSSNTILVLHYEFDGGSGFVKTDDESWHRLMRVYRHEGGPSVWDMHLVISKRFWELACWKQGPAEVLRQTSLCNRPNPNGLPNFLTKVAKIAAPAHRWNNHSRRDSDEEDEDYDRDKDPNHSAYGTRTHIAIDGADSEEKQKFVRWLQRYIRILQRARPLFIGGETFTRP